MDQSEREKGIDAGKQWAMQAMQKPTMQAGEQQFPEALKDMGDYLITRYTVDQLADPEFMAGVREGAEHQIIDEGVRLQRKLREENEQPPPPSDPPAD